MKIIRIIFYLLTGIVLVAGLVCAILFLRQLQPSIPVANASFSRAKGPFNAPIQLIEYSDFQCPACRTAQADLTSLLSLYPGRIRLVYQHFPLDGHRWSRLAHQAAQCADEQKQFWPYHDRLYQEQSYWSISMTAPLEFFMRYAKDAGLDLDRFSACLTDPKIDRKIQEERLTGLGLGVRSTPSFFVNGNLVVSVKTLRDEIDKIR